jgi:hypothetical protein
MDDCVRRGAKGLDLGGAADDRGEQQRVCGAPGVEALTVGDVRVRRRNEGETPPHDAALVVVFDVLASGRSFQIGEIDLAAAASSAVVTGAPRASSCTAVRISRLPV